MICKAFVVGYQSITWLHIISTELEDTGWFLVQVSVGEWWGGGGYGGEQNQYQSVDLPCAHRTCLVIQVRHISSSKECGRHLQGDLLIARWSFAQADGVMIQQTKNMLCIQKSEVITKANGCFMCSASKHKVLEIYQTKQLIIFMYRWKVVLYW